MILYLLSLMIITIYASETCPYGDRLAMMSGIPCNSIVCYDKDNNWKSSASRCCDKSREAYCECSGLDQWKSLCICR